MLRAILKNVALLVCILLALRAVILMTRERMSRSLLLVASKILVSCLLRLDSIDATKSNYTMQLLARHHHENLDLVDSPILIILLDRRTIHT
jgi:hypothetical protein